MASLGSQDYLSTKNGLPRGQQPYGFDMSPSAKWRLHRFFFVQADRKRSQFLIVRHCRMEKV